MKNNNHSLSGLLNIYINKANKFVNFTGNRTPFLELLHNVKYIKKEPVGTGVEILCKIHHLTYCEQKIPLLWNTIVTGKYRLHIPRDQPVQHSINQQHNDDV